MATQSNKLGKCITPIHLDGLLPTEMDHRILPSEFAVNEVVYYRKTIKIHGTKWDDYLKRPTLCKLSYSLCDWKAASSYVCFLLPLPTGGDKARQTELPGEWEATVSTSGKSKMGMKRILSWPIIFHIVLLCFVAWWTIKLPLMPQLLSQTQISAAPWHGTHSDLLVTLTLTLATGLTRSYHIVVLQRTQRSYYEKLKISTGDAKAATRAKKARANKNTHFKPSMSAPVARYAGRRRERVTERERESKTAQHL